MIQILASSLQQRMEHDEKNVLLHQLMQLSNVSLHLVKTIISTNPSDDDGIILVLGATAMKLYKKLLLMSYSKG